jgi:hypothetical protein
MGLKFRRGTTAQKSGSLAFGEPYVNTDLGTLQIGGASGDITLGASGTGSAGSFSGISGSSIDITGNAKIDGNLILGGAITIGDNVSDTVNVVASLSSSLIPSTTNTFDLGSTSKVWKDLYISTGSIKFVEGSTVISTLTQNAFNAISGGFITFSQVLPGLLAISASAATTGSNNFVGKQSINGNLDITGSIIPSVNNTYDLGDVNHFFRDLYISTGSIKMVSNGVVVSTLSNTGNGMVMDQGLVAKGDSSFGTSSAAITAVTGSLKVSGSISLIGTLSASTITGIGNVSLYSTSVDSRLVAAESFSSSLDSTFATDASVTIVSASAWGAFQSASAYSASASTDISASNAARVALSASVAASGFAVSSSVASATATSITTLSSSVKAVTDTFATSASVASATATSISTLSGSVKAVTDTFATSASVASATAASISTLSGSVFLVDATQTTNITAASASAWGAFQSASSYSGSFATRLAAAEAFSSSLDTTFATDASVTALSSSVKAVTDTFATSASVASATATSISTLSGSVKAVTDTFATSASVASATATSISTLSGSVKAVTDTFATSASVASATATSISTISGSVKTVTDAISGRVTTLEGKDISITLTGDVTGTGTITDLANVSFATTIAANSVALSTDTTGDYVASLVQGTGVTITNNSGEGATPTISIGQAVATNSAVSFASVSATGDIVAFSGSDRRLKNNIVNISDALNKVKQLNGVTWEWNEDANEVTKTAPSTGLIAQEVQAVLPEVVKEREDGYLGIDYSKMVGLLVEAIKEQQTQIAELKAEVEALKK